MTTGSSAQGSPSIIGSIIRSPAELLVKKKKVEKGIKKVRKEIKESLNESYFDGLYHIGNTPNLTLANLEVEKPVKGRDDFTLGKPSRGSFWLAKGLSWHNWATKERFSNTGGNYLYRVRLNPSSKILQIKNGREAPEEYIERKNEPLYKSRFVPPYINYEKIAKKYDGVQAYHLAPFLSWSVPTVVVWNKSAIQSIEYLGKVKDVLGVNKLKK